MKVFCQIVVAGFAKNQLAERRDFWQRLLKKKQEALGEYDLPEACANLALEILEKTNQGSIIIFLHGASAIEDTANKIKSRCRKGIEVIPVYKEKRDAKKELERTEGKRRVIVATNIAETSVTIPDLVYCINSGWIKQIVWDPAIQTQKLDSRLHSKDGNSQRGGRLGRNQDGFVYHLYAKDEVMDEHTSPEITRSCLDDSLAIVKSSGIARIGGFPWMEKADDWKNMASEMQRSDKSLSERGVTDERGHVLEKALALLNIPRSSTEASVLFVADEQGILFEVIVTLSLMSERDGTPHMGSNLYDPYKGFLCWESSWTAETKAKVSAIHQGLKLGCRDDLDFAVKLVFCFQQAKSSGVSEDWANYYCINFKNLERVVSQIEELIESLGDERNESLRQLNLDNLDKVRTLFFTTWPDRIINLISFGKQILYGAGPVSPNCAGNWEKKTRALSMVSVDEESNIGGQLQRFPTASFMVCEPSEAKSENFLCDQIFPVGCWVKTKKKSDSVIIDFSEIPSTLVLRFKKDVWSEERPDESVAYNEAFRILQLSEQSFEIKTSWIGEESEFARIVQWENENGNPVAVLISLSETDMQMSIGEKDDTVEVKIHCVARDPVGKNGWILGRTSSLEIPIELSNMSFSEVGWGLELIEGETLLLTVKGFEASGLPQLSNIEKAMDGLKKIVKEISESENEVKGKDGPKPFVDYTGIVVGIMKDQDRAAVAIQGENGVVHIFESPQASLPGGNLKYLRLGEKVIVRLVLYSDVIEISLPEKITDVEISKMPYSWKRVNGSRILVPICLEDKAISNWNARMESREYIQRRSWQYCLQARISLKDRLLKLVSGTVVKASVEEISQGKNGEFVGITVMIGDNIPCFIPANYVRSNGVHKGEIISVFIKEVDSETGFLQLNDNNNRKEWRIRNLSEQIMKVRMNVSENIAKRDDEDNSWSYRMRCGQWVDEGVAKIRELQSEINQLKSSMEV